MAIGFDPRLLGGNYTTQQALEADPTALFDRQKALATGFVGGDAWGDGRYNQYTKGYAQGQSSQPQPPAPFPPEQPFPVVPLPDGYSPPTIPRKPDQLRDPNVYPGAMQPQTQAGATIGGVPPQSTSELMGMTDTSGITPAGNTTYTPPVQTYTPPVQTYTPPTSVAPGYSGSVPLGQHVLSQTPGYVKPPSTMVADSIKLYTPDYSDPATGQVNPELLGGDFSDPNTITPAELQRRWRVRKAGFTGEWGVDDESAFSDTFRNLTTDFLVAGSRTDILPSLLGGAYPDAATIPESVLKERLRLREAGYNEEWGSRKAERFLEGTLGSEATPPTIGTPGFRNLGKDWLDQTGTQIRGNLLGGQYTDQATIPESVLRNRARFRNAGFDGEWGEGEANYWLIAGGDEGGDGSAQIAAGQEAWNAANGDPGEAIRYGAIAGGYPTPPSGPVTLPAGKETSRGAAPDVYIRTTREREYTDQEQSAGTPEFHRRIRTAFGYQGDFGSGGFNEFFKTYVADNPEAQDVMDTLTQEYQAGVFSPGASDTAANKAADRFLDPRLPEGAIVRAAMIPGASDQMVDPNSAQVTGDLTVPTAKAATFVAPDVVATDAALAGSTALTQAGVTASQAGTQAAQGQVSSQSVIEAQQLTKSAVSNIQAQQGTGIAINSAISRDIQAGELISEVSNAQRAAAYTEQIQVATATPSAQATVQGQLATLTNDFDASDPPSWAAGAIRAANEAMARRGLGSSSMAGQAILQATLESALPIAQADARTVAQFEIQNLSNRQQRAMLAAEQRATFLGLDFNQNYQIRVQNSARIGDIANANFTADQQIQLENSKIANTVNMQNLTNRQAVTIAEAAALAGIDQSNLGNRQQAAVSNAGSFLQQDFNNLSNTQAISVLKSQQNVQSLFTDQAARNATEQFNATSQNQVDQFFASLSQATQQANAAQINAQSQYNAGQANTVGRFNAEIADMRDRYNASNRLTIDQSNATFRRQVATADTAAVNRTNETNATNLLNISNTAYSDLFALYRDQLDKVFKSGESVYERITKLAVAEMERDGKYKLADDKSSSIMAGAIGSTVVKIFAAIK